MKMIVGLFVSYLCDLFFIFTFIFIIVNLITSWIQTHLFFWLFFKNRYVLLILDDTLDEKCEQISNSIRSASRCCLAFASFLANFSLALLMKSLLIKKACRTKATECSWKLAQLTMTSNVCYDICQHQSANMDHELDIFY